MAVGRTHDPISPPDSTPASVPLKISVSNEFSTGARGFFERWKSLLTGMAITARKATEKPQTLRYPFVKLTLSPRWRGALHLRGILGREMRHLDAPTSTTGGSSRSTVRGATTPSATAPRTSISWSVLLPDGHRPAEAYELVRDETFCRVLGRICHHPGAGRGQLLRHPIAIRPLHRMAYGAMRVQGLGPSAS
jgi:hypothetical protein